MTPTVGRRRAKHAYALRARALQRQLLHQPLFSTVQCNKVAPKKLCSNQQRRPHDRAVALAERKRVAAVVAAQAERGDAATTAAAKKVWVKVRIDVTTHSSRNGQRRDAEL